MARTSRGSSPFGCAVTETAEALANDPLATASVNLGAQTITLPGAGTVTFPIDRFSKTCLLEGVDELGFLQKHEVEIAAYERERAMAFTTKV